MVLSGAGFRDREFIRMGASKCVGAEGIGLRVWL